MSEFTLRDFWNRIKNTCVEKNISQKELAEKSGVREQYLSRQIINAVNASISQAATMADVLGVSVDFLFTGNLQNPLKSENEKLRKTIAEIHEIASN